MGIPVESWSEWCCHVWKSTEIICGQLVLRVATTARQRFSCLARLAAQVVLIVSASCCHRPSLAENGIKKVQ